MCVFLNLSLRFRRPSGRVWDQSAPTAWPKNPCGWTYAPHTSGKREMLTNFVVLGRDHNAEFVLFDRIPDSNAVHATDSSYPSLPVFGTILARNRPDVPIP